MDENKKYFNELTPEQREAAVKAAMEAINSLKTICRGISEIFNKVLEAAQPAVPEIANSFVLGIDELRKEHSNKLSENPCLKKQIVEYVDLSTGEARRKFYDMDYISEDMHKLCVLEVINMKDKCVKHFLARYTASGWFEVKDGMIKNAVFTGGDKMELLGYWRIWKLFRGEEGPDVLNSNQDTSDIYSGYPDMYKNISKYVGESKEDKNE